MSLSSQPIFPAPVTYLAFHFVFILPPIALLLWLSRGRQLPEGAWRSIALTMVIAFAYTTPWDNYLVYHAVWWYGQDRVIGAIGYVPIEEYLFFLLQPVLTGLFYTRFFARGEGGSVNRNAHRAITALLAALSLWGVWMLTAGGTSWTYLGLILAWACPVLVGMWAYAGAFFSQHLRTMSLAIAIPTVYLWIADRIAIGLEIWTISEETSTGVMLFGLPVEEATFFLLTNLLVVSGISLFMNGDRIAALRRAARPAAHDAVSS